MRDTFPQIFIESLVRIHISGEDARLLYTPLVDPHLLWVRASCGSGVGRALWDELFKVTIVNCAKIERAEKSRMLVNDWRIKELLGMILKTCGGIGQRKGVKRVEFKSV